MAQRTTSLSRIAVCAIYFSTTVSLIVEGFLVLSNTQRCRCLSPPRSAFLTVASAAVSGNDDGNNDSAERYTRFLDWLFQKDGCSGRENILIRDGDFDTSSSQEQHQHHRRQRRGLFAAKSFRPGDSILEVPFSAALVVETTETTDAQRGKRFLELQQQSAYQPYMDVLPTRDDDDKNWDPTPDFWQDEQIQKLEFPRLVRAVLERKRRIERLAKEAEIALDDLQFATWLVESRSLTLVKEPYPDAPDEELETTSVMIPVLDMINHSSDEPNAKLEVVEVGGVAKGEEELAYAVVALERISVGEEVTIAYGTGEESSVELLQYYGFVPASNSYDVDMINYLGDDDEEDRLLEEDDWSTTLDEDEEELRDATGVERTILSFRIRLKEAIREWDALEEEEEDEDEE